jgi:hypothetical protein
MQDIFDSSRRNFNRGLMVTGGALGISGLGGNLAANAAVPDGLPTDPVAINRAMVKMAGSLKPTRVSWSTRGRIYAVLPDGVSTLYDFRGCETAWWEQTDENTWIRYFSANSIFVDPETQQPIHEHKSPFNGEVVEVRPTNIRHKEGFVYSPEGHYFPSLKKRYPAQYADRALNPKWRRDGDVVRYVGEDHFPPFLAQPSREVASHFCNASQLLDDSVDWADATVAGWNIWSGEREPYKSMGVLPGLVNWHFDGIKIRDLSELDSDYLAEIRRVQPQFDENPKNDEGLTFFEMVLSRMGGA